MSVFSIIFSLLFYTFLLFLVHLCSGLKGGRAGAVLVHGRLGSEGGPRTVEVGLGSTWLGSSGKEEGKSHGGPWLPLVDQGGSTHTIGLRRGQLGRAGP
jgi:hypothetical protein